MEKLKKLIKFVETVAKYAIFITVVIETINFFVEKLKGIQLDEKELKT